MMRRVQTLRYTSFYRPWRSSVSASWSLGICTDCPRRKPFTSHCFAWFGFYTCEILGSVFVRVDVCILLSPLIASHWMIDMITPIRLYRQCRGRDGSSRPWWPSTLYPRPVLSACYQFKSSSVNSFCIYE